MTEIDSLNKFIQRQDLSSIEKVIRDQLIELDQSIKVNSQDREKLTNSLKEKEVEFLRLSGAFDAQLKLILSLPKPEESV